MIVGFISSLLGAKFKPGASDLSAEDMYRMGYTASGDSSKIPLVPHPSQAMLNNCTVTKEGVAICQVAFDMTETNAEVAARIKAGEVLEVLPYRPRRLGLSLLS